MGNLAQAATPALTRADGVSGSSRLRARVAVALGALALVLALGGIALIAANGGAEGPNGRDYTPGTGIAALAYGLMGAALVRRGTAIALGAVALGIGLLMGLACMLSGIAVHAWDGDGPAAATAAIWVVSWSFAPAVLAIPTLLLLLLPDGRLLTPRWKPVVFMAVAGIVFAALGLALGEYPLSDLPRDFAGASNPLLAQGVADVANVLAAVFLAPAIVLSIASLVLRFRRAPDFERGQLKWVGLGAAATLILQAGAFAAGSHGDLVQAASTIPLPLGIAVAVLRHGMWDVDLVINRSLVYGVLTAIVIGIYVAVVSLVTELVARPAAGVVAVALVALAFHPLHARVQRAVNRLIYGDRDDPAAALRRLGERLVGAGEADEVLPAAAETVGRALRLPYVRITVEGGDGGSFGDPVGDPLAVALLYRGRRVGELEVSPRERGAQWSRADRRAIEAIGRQVAVAAHAVRLSQDLRRSRERLVMAREEERRRIRRDLHDELGPRLAALALELDTAREADPEDIDAAVSRAADRAREGIADVRRLVYDLRPRTLDDFGLEGALREQAERLSSDGLTVSVTVEQELGDLPAAVEAAAYRIASEAMTNAARHAGARRCDVTLAVGDGRLWLGVSDDGQGIDGEAERGVGLASMEERATELGGTFELQTTPGAGTRILAGLPLRER